MNKNNFFISCRYLDNTFKLYKAAKKITHEHIWAMHTGSFVNAICKVNDNAFITGHYNGMLSEWKLKVETTSTAAEKVAAAQQAIEQAQAGMPVEEQTAPKKRKVSKKKTASEETPESDDTSENSTEETNAPEVVPAPEAPLNDVDPFSANTTGFNMFDQPAEPANNPVPDMPMPMFDEGEQAF
jgi:hypothetical protein